MKFVCFCAASVQSAHGTESTASGSIIGKPVRIGKLNVWAATRVLTIIDSCSCCLTKHLSRN